MSSSSHKIRELLATRPAVPTLLELTRWWNTSAMLLEQLYLDYEAADCDLVAERAEHRRTRDERANLRVELDRLKSRLGVYERMEAGHA